MPRNPGFPRGRPAGRAKAQPRDPNRVPAAQYDVMRAPLYVQGNPPPVRPGALDFKRIESKLFAKESNHA